MASDLQTPFANPICPTPSGAGDGVATSGGFDFPDGRKETPNSESGLALLPTTYDIPGGDPGVGGSVPMPPVSSPGTIPTTGPTE